MTARTLPQCIRLLAMVLLVVLLAESSAWACPTCKAGLGEHDPEHAALVQGYFWSIVFMMSMPFLILAGLSSYFYLLVRRARQAEAVAHAELRVLPEVVPDSELESAVTSAGHC